MEFDDSETRHPLGEIIMAQPIEIYRSKGSEDMKIDGYLQHYNDRLVIYF